MSFSRYPVGGYKMVFEYANKLYAQGYRISILFINDEAMKQYCIPELIRKPLANFLTQITPRWFLLNKNIRKISTLQEDYLREVQNTDVVVATSVLTVEKTIAIFKRQKKIYFIQGYENWDKSEDYLKQTYNIGMNNFVIAKWLKDIVDINSNCESTLVSNPIDCNIYKPFIKQCERPNHSVAFLYHVMEHKGVKYAIEAIKTLKNEYPDLIVRSFGMYRRPAELPEWVEYTYQATQDETVEIYNSVQVFVCATVEEGFGLTGLEAMACGATLCTTNYMGAREYANKENAMLSDVKDPVGLANNISKLFEDENLRVKLSTIGIETARARSWKNAINKWVSVIEN